MKKYLLAFMVFISISCAGKKSKIVFWNGYTGPDRPVLEKIVEEYNKTAEIKIEMEIMPWDSLFQKLSTAIVAGTGPDLIVMSVGRLPEYIDADIATDVTEMLDKSQSLSKDTLVPALIDASTKDGKLYGMPMSFASMVMYYNKSHFKKAGLDPENPPQNVADFDKAIKTLTVKEGAQTSQYGFAGGVKATVPVIPVLMWMYNGDVIKNGESCLLSENSVKAITWVEGLFKNGQMPIGLTGQETDNLFAAGKASMTFNGPWAINGFRGAGIDLGIAEVPKGVSGERKTWGGDTVFVISDKSKQKEEAWKFIEYWNNKDTQRIWASEVGFPPTRLDMGSDTELLSKNPDIKYFLNSAPYSVIFLAGETKTRRIEEEILAPLFESVCRGNMNSKDALNKYSTDLDRLLKE